MASVRFNPFTRGILLAGTLLVLGLVLDLGKAAAWHLQAQSRGQTAVTQTVNGNTQASIAGIHRPLALYHPMRHHAHQLHHWFFALTRSKVFHVSSPDPKRSAPSSNLSANTG